MPQGVIQDAKDWQNPQFYEWTKLLTQRACAWEFLRRNPWYRAAWTTVAPARDIDFLSPNLTTIKLTSSDVDPEPWGLLRPFEDPNRNAREANVFWSPVLCPAVLPVVGVSEGRGKVSPPAETYGCSMTIYVDTEGSQHILFSEAGRSLQLEVRGAPIATAHRLLADVPRSGNVAAARLRSIKQLADLEVHRTLRSHLYPPHGQGRRLVEILQALDGKLLGASHREIAVALYGTARVASDWVGQNRQMRDKVRKTIERGLALMEGGYKQFLK